MTGKRCKRNLDLIRIIPKQKIAIEPKNVPAINSEITEPIFDGAVTDSAPQNVESQNSEISTEAIYKNLENILENTLENEPTNPEPNQGRIRRKPNYLADYQTD